MLIRNEWTHKLRVQMIHIVSNRSQNMIQMGKRHELSDEFDYDKIPEYEYIYRKIFNWNKAYFLNMLESKLEGERL